MISVIKICRQKCLSSKYLLFVVVLWYGCIIVAFSLIFHNNLKFSSTSSPPVFCWHSCCLIFSFLCNVWRSLFVHCVVCPFLQLLITLLASSNFSSCQHVIVSDYCLMPKRALLQLGLSQRIKLVFTASPLSM
jgi:hypothetical protein